jgi:glycosyltransferase involved in cell wall biosynthesis
MAQPIRVALDARVYGARGIGRYTEALHHGLLANSARVAVTAFGGRREPRSGIWKQLAWPGYVLQEQVEMSWRFAGSEFEVIHLTANTAPAIRRRWPPTVVTVHDVMYLMSPSELALSPSARQTIGRAYRFLAFKSGTINVDHIISDSTYTADQLRKRFGERLPPITVIHPGLDDSFFVREDSGVTDAVLRRYGLKSRGYFLHPGAVDPRKNTSVVLKAFREYRVAHGRGALVIIGLSDLHRSRLHSEFQDVPGVQLLPFVDNETAIALLKAARALVYVPSEEGFGYPLVEALATGTPAITSSIDVLSEMADGVTWSVPPGRVEPLVQHMLTFEHKTAEISERVNSGIQRSRHFAMQRAAEETIEVYEQVRRSSRARLR